MGTDSPQMFNVPGFALHRELAVAAKAGLTYRQILPHYYRGATIAKIYE